MTVLPMKCRRYLTERGIAFQEIQDGGNQAVILQGISLPVGRFDVSSVSVLILLPSGYPDSPPDMFYVFPWIRLISRNSYPTAADQPLFFVGQKWQRWSRHNNIWRPGVDGIWTMLKRVKTALEAAA